MTAPTTLLPDVRGRFTPPPPPPPAAYLEAERKRIAAIVQAGRVARAKGMDSPAAVAAEREADAASTAAELAWLNHSIDDDVQRVLSGDSSPAFATPSGDSPWITLHFDLEGHKVALSFSPLSHGTASVMGPESGRLCHVIAGLAGRAFGPGRYAAAARGSAAQAVRLAAADALRYFRGRVTKIR